MPTDQPTREFALDRERLRAALLEEHDEIVGLSHFGGDLSRQIIEATTHADAEAKAITGPDGVEFNLYSADGDLLIGVREIDGRAQPPGELRQIASFAIETRRIADWERGEDFDELCGAIEAVLGHVNRLLPAYHALKAGEAAAAPR